MYLKLAFTTAVTAVAALALLLASSTGGRAGTVPVIAIDMDISDGACTDIDATREQASGSFQVAVCLVENPGGVEVAAFQFRVNYDDTVIVAPEVANAGSALDDNPDANIGTTSFSTPNLGTDPNSWTCATVGAFPVGDANAATGPGNGQAFSGGCGNESGVGVTLVEGPLSVITFNVVGTGTTTLTLSNTSATDNNLAEIGSCNPTQETAATCTGGTFTTGGVEPTVTNTTVPTATNTTVPTSTNTTVPTSTNTTVPTATNTTVPTATNTTVATATNTTVPTATNTTVATATNTTVPTATNTTVATATNTTVPTATNTTVATATNTTVPTATNTTVATATNTTVPTATNTTVPTATNTTVPPTATKTTAPATNTPQPTATKTKTNTPVPTNTSVPGDCEEDVNNDGKVNFKDLLIVLKSLHNDNPRGDVDGDGDVDLRDLLLVAKAILRTAHGRPC